MTQSSKTINKTEEFELHFSGIKYSFDIFFCRSRGEGAKKLLEIVDENGEFDLDPNIPEVEKFYLDKSKRSQNAKVREVNYDVFKRSLDGSLCRCIANTSSKDRQELLYSIEFQRYIELGKPDKLFLRRSDELYQK